MLASAAFSPSSARRIFHPAAPTSSLVAQESNDSNTQSSGYIPLKFVFPLFHIIRPLKTLQNLNFLRDRCEFIDGSKFRFLRDSQIALASGTHLVPYVIKGRYLEILRAILPETATHFNYNIFTDCLPKDCFVGTGFSNKNVEKTECLLKEMAIPFKRGVTCIEGGNCFLFTHQGQRKAIVGEISLYLSFIALDQQGFFKDLPYKDIGEPLPSSYKLARNIELYESHQRPIDEAYYRIVDIRESTDQEYRVKQAQNKYFRIMLTLPVDEDTHKKFREEAQFVQAKLNHTRKIMAEELEIDLKNLIIIPQTQFHIDMEMLITPFGEVILNDYKEVARVLPRIRRAISGLIESEEAKELYELFKNSSLDDYQLFHSVTKQKLSILRENGISFQKVPLAFRSHDVVLNLVNGIFFRKNSSDVNEHHTLGSYVFVTTGGSLEEENPYLAYLIRRIELALPQLEIVTLPTMSLFIANYDGGLRCLSLEHTE